MNIKSEKDITGPAALHLRVIAQLSQAAFWKLVGVSQSAGSRFESGAISRVVKPVRILIFARYVVGLDIDATSPEGTAGLVRLAQAQAALRAPDPQ